MFFEWFIERTVKANYSFILGKSIIALLEIYIRSYNKGD